MQHLDLDDEQAAALSALLTHTIEFSRSSDPSLSASLYRRRRCMHRRRPRPREDDEVADSPQHGERREE